MNVLTRRKCLPLCLPCGLCKLEQHSSFVGIKAGCARLIWSRIRNARTDVRGLLSLARRMALRIMESPLLSTLPVPRSPCWYRSRTNLVTCRPNHSTMVRRIDLVAICPPVHGCQVFPKTQSCARNRLFRIRDGWCHLLCGDHANDREYIAAVGVENYR